MVILYTLVLLGYVLVQQQKLDQQLVDELRLSSAYDDAYAKAELYWQSSADSWRKSVNDPDKYLGHTVSLDTAKATLFVAEAKVIECRMLQQAYRNLTVALEKTDRSAIAQARLEVAKAQCFSYGYANEHYDSWAEAMPDYGVGVSELRIFAAMPTIRRRKWPTDRTNWPFWSGWRRRAGRRPSAARI